MVKIIRMVKIQNYLDEMVEEMVLMMIMKIEMEEKIIKMVIIAQMKREEQTN